MIVIVEGVDGTGKTSLAERIASTYEENAISPTTVGLKHTGPPKGSVIEEYLLPFLKIRPDRDHLVLDRLYWSNIVYAPVYRKRVETDEVKRKFFDLFWLARGAVAVHCSQDLDILVSRLNERGETYTNIDDLPALLSAYEDVAMASYLPVVFVQLEHDEHWVQTAQEVIDLTENFASKSAEIADSLPFYLGKPDPEIVICVDKSDSLLLSGQDDTPEDYCLRNILAHIPDVAWHSTAVVNPFHLSVDHLKRLNKAKIVAIGKPVSDWLIQKRIKHGGIARPETVDYDFLPGWGRRVIDMAASQRFQLPGV